VKFIFKEEFVPDDKRKFLFYAAPVIGLVPGALAFGAIPLSIPINIETFEMLGSTWGPYNFAFQSFEMGIGIVFVLGVSSLAAYPLLIAGYGSSNKYSLLGALRASAQMISYELALGLSLVGILLIYNSFDFAEIIETQIGAFTFSWLGAQKTISFLPNWRIFYQPLGFILFFTAVFAEANRLPFDLPEAESELVAGYHTEYGGLKMLMFYIAEYGHMLVSSALCVVFYFGGYNLPFISPEQVQSFVDTFGWGVNATAVVTAFILFTVFLLKVLLFLWVFIWVRWTLPRFRYDQLMDLGWKTMLPWALGNTIVTAIVVFILRTDWV
jgi:NADH-quinone oxidoreductase subunit H